MARILDTFRRELPEANLTFNVGVLGGGTPATLDAQEVTVTATGQDQRHSRSARCARRHPHADRRAGPAHPRPHAADRRAAPPRHEGRAGLCRRGYPPMAPSPGNLALLARLNEVNRALGLPKCP
jgi:glutamate carboxypeptidase